MDSRLTGGGGNWHTMVGNIKHSLFERAVQVGPDCTRPILVEALNEVIRQPSTLLALYTADSDERALRQVLFRSIPVVLAWSARSCHARCRVW